MTAVLYRHFSASGELLYIGCSMNVLMRTQGHSYTSTWFDEIANITIEHFDNFADALKAEAEAIRRECPRENIVHKDDDVVRRRIKRYESGTPHPQLDCLKSHFAVSESTLRRILKIGAKTMEEIRESGRALNVWEIKSARNGLRTTYKQLAALNICERTGISLRTARALLPAKKEIA